MSADNSTTVHVQARVQESSTDTPTNISLNESTNHTNINEPQQNPAPSVSPNSRRNSLNKTASQPNIFATNINPHHPHTHNHCMDNYYHYYDILKLQSESKDNSSILNNSWQCNQCNAHNIMTALHCFYCNSSKPYITNQERTDANNRAKECIQIEVDRIPKGMWHCIMCGTNNLIRTRYCTSCDSINPTPVIITITEPSNNYYKMVENTHYDYCCGLEHELCGLGPKKFHFNSYFVITSIFKCFLLSICAYFMWTGIVSLNKECNQPIAEWLISMSSFAVATILLTFSPICLRYKWRKRANTPVVTLFYLLLTVGFIIGSAFVFSTSDSECDFRLYRTGYVICICYWILAVAVLVFSLIGMICYDAFYYLD